MNIKSNNPDFNEQDNEFFAAYLEGGSALSEIYNNIDSAGPSNKLNQTILSAAKASTKQSTDSKKWWTQAGSWAASVAIISLAGILAHNTWQAEEDTVHQGRITKQTPAPGPDKAGIETDTQIEQSTQTRTRAKKNISSDNSKDSRKLLYKSAPAPVMQSAPAYFEPTKAESLLKEKSVHQFNDIHEEVSASPEVEVKKAPKSQLSEQQIALKKIIQLIENNEITQAQKLLLQFKTKYPDYPIDPVILKRLSPY